ncbi:MAG: hypothetical protein ACRDIL_21320 [Candidatus Limnocylindrales bacterium]
MGKASSAKKVARAARAGGRRSSAGRQRNLLFPGVIGAIVLLGSALVWYAADERKGDTNVPPVIGDHWHAAYGFYVCGEWQPDIPEFEATTGIHTHGDGVIHIHPFSQSGAGENATLGTFLEDTDVKLSDSELTIGQNELPDGAKTWKEGEDQCDGKDAELVVAQWEDVSDESAKPALLTGGLSDIRFRGDGEGYTIAFVPEGETDIPKPQTAANLAELGAVDAGAQPGSSTTTAPGGSTTTTAGGGATTTTTAGDATTTTAGG